MVALDELDPNGIGLSNNHYFALPFSNAMCEVLVFEIPKDHTTSNGSGTSRGPAAVHTASPQIHYWNYFVPGAYQVGIGRIPAPPFLESSAPQLRAKAEQCISHLEKGGLIFEDAMLPVWDAINSFDDQLNRWLKAKSRKLLTTGKLLGVLGGDHSSPLGLIEALAEKYDEFSIVHFDAHCDTRQAYEGFLNSHASIMDNALRFPQVKNIIQIGVRDISLAEYQRSLKKESRVTLFPAPYLHGLLYEGQTWKYICRKIINKIRTKHVYVSFDIDCLEVHLCPNTGTPVPGGLNYDQPVYFLHQLLEHHHEMIGFDLCEVAPSPGSVAETYALDLNAIVGMRMLYNLATLGAQSRGWRPQVLE